jgi:hypothetical protein
MFRIQLYVVVTACLLSGCTATPLIKYTPVTGPDNEGLTKFQFAESIINFSHGKSAAGIQNDDVVISSVPVPFGDRVYGISGTSIWENWGVSTTVNASYRGDSRLIQQLTVAISDQRQQAMQALGSIIGTVGGLLSISSTPAPVKLPKGIAVTSFLNNLPADCSNPNDLKVKVSRDADISCQNLALEGTTDYTADITVSKVPIDAIPASTMDSPMSTGNFLYSACRQLTITLKPTNAGSDPVAATVAIADPSYLQTLRIPEKGTITVAPSCGANSVAQDPGLPTALDYLNTLATQAKAVKQALAGTASSGVSSSASKPATGAAK